MAATNLSWAYWLDYFRLSEDELRTIREENGQVKGLPDLNSRNQVFFEVAASQFNSEIDRLKIPNSQGFELVTTYPGLLFGTGYQHEIGANGELKLGFFFDYTTGWPVIPGASVKGLLRSAFHSMDKNRSETNSAFLKVLAEAVEPQPGALIQVVGDAELFKAFTDRVFGPATRDKEGRKPENNLSVYDRDVFHDAVIVKSNHPYIEGRGEDIGQIFGRDFITPHKSPFSDPVPIQFMKILPKVHVLFQFDLKDTVLSVGENEIRITADKKLALFKAIILHLGVGAKTNVGYGQFVEPVRFEVGQEVEAVVKAIDRSTNRVTFFLTGFSIRHSQPLSKKQISNMTSDDRVVLHISSIREDGSIKGVKIKKQN